MKNIYKKSDYFTKTLRCGLCTSESIATRDLRQA